MPIELPLNLTPNNLAEEKPVDCQTPEVPIPKAPIPSCLFTDSFVRDPKPDVPKSLLEAYTFAHYKVRPGDTLYQIVSSRIPHRVKLYLSPTELDSRIRTEMRRVCQINGIADPDKIGENQIINF